MAILEIASLEYKSENSDKQQGFDKLQMRLSWFLK